MMIGAPNSNSRPARHIPDMRSWILADGNWIADRLRIMYTGGVVSRAVMSEVFGTRISAGVSGRF